VLVLLVIAIPVAVPDVTVILVLLFLAILRFIICHMPIGTQPIILRDFSLLLLNVIFILLLILLAHNQVLIYFILECGLVIPHHIRVNNLIEVLKVLYLVLPKLLKINLLLISIPHVHIWFLILAFLLLWLLSRLLLRLFNILFLTLPKTILLSLLLFNIEDSTGQLSRYSIVIIIQRFFFNI
jgi:hypothetical protein